MLYSVICNMFYNMLYNNKNSHPLACLVAALVLIEIIPALSPGLQFLSVDLCRPFNSTASTMLISSSEEGEPGTSWSNP